MQPSKNIIRTTKRLIRAYAELDENGRPQRCQPTEEEIATGDWKPGGKVVYPTERAALDYAYNLREAGGLPQSVYECPRRGHWHSTTRTQV
jgi:hypothetical protein